MFLQGHLEILRDVLTKVNNYFDDNFASANMNLMELKKGIVYPDIPCGTYKKIKRNEIFLTDKKLCPEFDLVELLSSVNNFREIYMSHRGTFAYMHSMTNDPDSTVKTIRDKIVLKILSLALLSIYDKNIFNKAPKFNPSIFWIGSILHTITDSYSQSHAIRVPSTAYKVIAQKSTGDIFSVFARDLRQHILDAASTMMTAGRLEKRLCQKYKNDPTKVAYIKRNKRNIYDSYKIFKFDKSVGELVARHYNLPRDNIVKSKHRKYDIINFQYVFNQHGFYHSRRDFLSAVKNHPGLYEKMIRECVHVLSLYKECIVNRDTNTFIKKLHEYMLTETFYVPKKYLNDKTGSLLQK